MKKIIAYLAGLVFAPVTAFAQEVVPACDFDGVVQWFTTGNIVAKVGGILFIVAMVIFGFLNKSMPAWGKDFAIGFLGRKAKP